MANPLSSCVTSLQSTTQLLGSTISILDSGVNDYPRLARVLRTTRHFELLPESTLQTAQSSLLSSLTPELNTLLSRVEAHLDKSDRRSQSLAARCELLEGRLSSTSNGKESGGVGRDSAGKKGGKGAGGLSSVDEKQVLKMKQLKIKKERLAYAVETLELQARQRERQLRMSVAAS